MSATDAVPVLRSRGGVLAKRLSHGPAGWACIAFSAGTLFSAQERLVASFADLIEVLRQNERDSHACALRGRLLPHVDPRRHRRLSNRAEHGDAVTYRGVPPTLDRARYRRRARAALPHLRGRARGRRGARARAAARAVRRRLVLVAGDGSAGIKPGIRCRLWFWLEPPRERRRGEGLARALPRRPQPVHAGGAPLHRRRRSSSRARLTR